MSDPDDNDLPGGVFPLRQLSITRAYWRFLNAVRRRETIQVPSGDAALEHEILTHAQNALREYSRSHKERPPWVLPHQIASYIADGLSEILAGREPAAWRAARKHRVGRPKRGLVADRNIAMAVIYVRACAQGIIDDASPNKTVRAVYGVASSTVRGWCANPAFSEYRPDMLPDGFPSPHDGRPMPYAELLRSLLEYSGEAFRANAGNQSHAAIRSRALRRRATK